MIPIYPNGLVEQQTFFLLNELTNRVEFLEERDIFNKELIRLLIVDNKIAKDLLAQQEAKIENLNIRNNKLEKKQQQIRSKFGLRVKCYLKNLRNIRIRIETIEDRIDNLNTQMSKLSIN